LPDLPLDNRSGAIAELGSGWGGVAFAMARRYPGHPVTGFELSLLPWMVSQLRLIVFPQENLRFLRKDFMQADLTGVILAICYLSPQSMSGLGTRLEEQMSNEALVLSNTFAIRGWRELEHTIALDMYKSPVYLYEIGNI
jgi:16S rRNA A1518/A1519 N6-dimethyltransferase RsmA/KsgA/DIM1 with predicted DNA glycosylase/AP lyase activity